MFPSFSVMLKSIIDLFKSLFKFLPWWGWVTFLIVAVVFWYIDIKFSGRSYYHSNRFKSRRKSTPQAKKLFYALKKRKISSELEHWDGNKHVDISIPRAKIDIEVDGSQHYTDPKQIKSDIDRSFYSATRNDKRTIHIPNAQIDNNLDQIADAIAQTVQERNRDTKEE